MNSKYELVPHDLVNNLPFPAAKLKWSTELNTKLIVSFSFVYESGSSHFEMTFLSKWSCCCFSKNLRSSSKLHYYLNFQKASHIIKNKISLQKPLQNSPEKLFHEIRRTVVLWDIMKVPNATFKCDRSRPGYVWNHSHGGPVLSPKVGWWRIKPLCGLFGGRHCRPVFYKRHI